MIAIYARVSTEEQARNGYSLSDQLRECRKLAGTDDIEEYVDEGVSGEYLDRPQLSRLRNDIRLGKITKVICLDPDRLSRKLVNQLIISEEIEKKASLVFVNGEYSQTAEGKLFYQLRGAISEFEKAKINERMCRGRREKARQGKVVRNYHMYGYDYDNASQQFILNAFEAEIVRMIFNLFTQPCSEISGINGIAKYLTAHGIPTKRGATTWHRQVVRQILMNTAYIGEFYQNKWNSEGVIGNKFKPIEDRKCISKRPIEDWIAVPCPPIVDRQIFFYAQELLKESRRRWAGAQKNRYLLSGLVRCGICGNTMTGRKSKQWSKYIFEYQDIKSTAGAKYRGCGQRIRTDILDAIVWDTVKEMLGNFKELSDSCSLPNDAGPKMHDCLDIQKMMIKINKLKQNIINLISDFNEGPESNDIKLLLTSLGVLKAKEEQLKEYENMLHSKINESQNLSKNHNIIIEAVKYYLSEGIHELTFDDRQHLIRCLIKEVRVYNNKVVIFGF